MTANTTPTKTNSADDLDVLKEQFDILKTEMKAMAEMIGSTAKDRAEGAKDDAVTRMELLGSEARRRVNGLQSEAEDAVLTNPLTALAISAGVGFIIGAMTRR